MSDTYSQRKYAGLPRHELRQIPKEPAPKKFHGVTKTKKEKPDVEIIDFWKIRPPRDKKWWFYGGGVAPVHVGTRVSNWCVQKSGEHVTRRLRAYLVRSRSMGIFWLENEATRKQISPEFSSYDCLLDWLLYLGLSKGWVWVETWWCKWDDKHRAKLEIR